MPRAIKDPVKLAQAARIVKGALERSRKEQGLPPTIEDPEVLDRIATIIER